MAKQSDPVLQQKFDRLANQAGKMSFVVGLSVQTPGGELDRQNTSKLDAVIVWPKGESPKDLDKRVCCVYVLGRALDDVAEVVLEELKKVA